ncbi:MAG: purine-binding chemotaxis protein CheW [Deltaproteobacteria bacterium]|nr:purine-binding chemotaxis protein CheW [Deltaproteobacteria bacterium]
MEEVTPSYEDDYQKGLFLTFRIGNEDFGLEIRYVTEIIGIQKITEVPDMPVFMQGVINLRGKVIPVMDIRLRFGLPSREYDERTCIIVVQVGKKSVGLVVDKVNEVASISDDAIEPPPRTEGNGYIQGIGKNGDEVKILLDVQRLLYEDGEEDIPMDEAC